MLTRRKTVLTIALLTLSAATPFAYVTNGRWMGNSTTMRLSAASFPAASPEQNAVVSAIDKWNLNPSNFRFNVLFNDTSVAKGNGQSEIWFTPALGHPAATYPIYDAAGNLIEADIIFNDDKCWAFNPTDYTTLEGYGTNCRLMEASAIHELGHALGLAHEADEYNVMGNAWTHVHVNQSTADAYVGEDASNGAVSLYGLAAAAGEELSVSHWKYDAVATGASDYSHHRRVELFDGSGKPLTGTTIEDGATRYDVTSGQTIQVEFTYENSGASLQTPQVDLVLSENNWITIFDTWLATHHPVLGRNSVYTHCYTVTLPGGLTPGFKWIGAVIDPANVINEVDETDNATWIPINVK
jgi:matrixin